MFKFGIKNRMNVEKHLILTVMHAVDVPYPAESLFEMLEVSQKYQLYTVPRHFKYNLAYLPRKL